VINTSTTIITFRMVFQILLQFKLDELILAMETANKALLDLEGLDD